MKHNLAIARCWPLSVLLTVAGPVAAGTIPITWVGGNGNWSNTDNWDAPIFPCSAAHDAIIPAGVSVTFDVTECEISSLSLPAGSTLTTQPGTDLAVAVVAEIGGQLVADGGSFSVGGAGATLPNGARLKALNSGTINLTGPPSAAEVRFDVDSGGHIEVSSLLQYSSVGLAHTTVYFDVDGEGSTLSFPDLTSLDSATTISGGGWHAIKAVNGGSIDMPSLISVSGPGDIDDTLYIDSFTGGSIQLDALASITGAGRTWIRAHDTSTLLLPALTTTELVRFEVRSGASVEASSLQQYSSVGLAHMAVFFDVDGEGSTLGLPALTSVDSATTISGGGWHEIKVTNGGSIDLSSLDSVSGPGDTDDTLYIDSFTGGSIQLDALASISGTGRTWIRARDTSTLLLPTLTTAELVRFEVRSGATVEASSLQQYSSVGLAHMSVFFDVDGEGSSLTLPALTSLDSATTIGGGGWHEIKGTNGGLIDMPVLISINGPGDSDDTLYVDSFTGGSIQLDALESITGSGRTWLRATDGDSLVLPAPTTTERVRFSVSSGATIEASVLQQYSSVGLAHMTVFFDVDGEGSTLSLPALTSLDSATTISGGGWHRIEVTNGGLIDMPSLISIDGPGDNTDTLFVDSLGGSSVIASSLNAISALGVVSFGINGGAELRTGSWESMSASMTVDIQDAFSSLVVDGDLKALPGTSVSVTLAGAGSILDVEGSILLGSNVGLVTAEGSQVTAGGDRYCYSHTDETQMSTGSSEVWLDGPGLQRLEVGGFDVGLVCNLGDDNFGIGRLVVGRDDQAGTVELQNLVDNGNGGPALNPEALYLLGDGSGQSSLALLGGSTLVLNDLNLYVFDDCIDGVGVNPIHVNSLFGPGEQSIELFGGTIELGSATTVADVNGDGCVDVDDLIEVILSWGSCTTPCPADLNCDGQVGVDDLIAVILNWGC